MKKLDKYIAKQIIIGFLIVTFSLLSIVWLTQSLNFVELVTSKGLPIFMFVEMTSLLMPRIFVIMAPIALFVSVLFVYNRLIADRELMVMKAAGISPLNLAKAAIFVGSFISVFNLYVNNIVIPVAEQKLAQLQWQAQNDMSHMMFKEGEFTTVEYQMTVFVSKYDKNGSVYGILVNDERDRSKKVTLSSERGRVIYTPSGPRLILVNGVRNELTRDSKKQFSSLAFDRYSVDFGVSGKNKEKETGARELTLKELLFSFKNKALTQIQINRYMTEGFKRILIPLYNIIFALIACTGLLVGNFNRRGQGKIITVAIMSMVCVQSLDLAFASMTVKHLYFCPLMFLNFLLPLFTCFYFLLFYNPARKKKHKDIKDLMNV
ncbi:MAG: LptF/LptG family permease [Alphaproteobacteria bacterium]|nr:LptF/LptG family permease [Alphaproteobacteria bacterium]